jgi:hypothetical protein
MRSVGELSFHVDDETIPVIIGTSPCLVARTIAGQDINGPIHHVVCNLRQWSRFVFRLLAFADRKLSSTESL